LTLKHIQPAEGRWVIVDISGKGGRIRSVPMVGWCKALDAWVEAGVMTEGTLIRPLNRAGRICGASMDPNAVWSCVQKSRTMARCRIWCRTIFALLSLSWRTPAKAPLEQIQISLGHSSITTGKIPRRAKSFPLFSGFGRYLLMWMMLTYSQCAS